MPWRQLMFGLLLCYGATYFGFRSKYAEAQPGGPPIVNFPVESTWIYYFYRPLTWLDGTLTGTQFHIGPHRN